MKRVIVVGVWKRGGDEARVRDYVRALLEHARNLLRQQAGEAASALPQERGETHHD